MNTEVSRRAFLQLAAAGALLTGHVRQAIAQTPSSNAANEWALTATIIEACSCTMFCPCYFSTVPSAHDHGSMAEQFCRFNMGYLINKGHLDALSLDGMKFWIAGDLGADFSKGGEWAEITFEPSATTEQRAAITTIVPHVYPLTWKSFTVGADARIEWAASNDQAVARLNGGRAAEVVLRRLPGMTQDPVTIANLKYFGAPRNRGFILMPNEVDAYRVGPRPFEYKGTNGFMITYDITSKDIKS